ncbi:MAG: methyltransferase domain-containing protein [Vicinamibacterales bacterium]
MDETADPVARWLTALEARHLADLRFVEVSRALRALSSAYVERRHTLGRGSALDGRGKRAAFSLFYAPLHFLTVARIVDALDARLPAGAPIVDIGCGTGVSSAAWALAQEPPAAISGVDASEHAVQEARWTWARLGLAGTARRGDAAALPASSRRRGVVAGWVLNELSADTRQRTWASLARAAGAGDAVLVIEPIARTVSPWWDEVAAEVLSLGGRADEWRFPAELPPIVAKLDRAAGLSHRELTARSCYIPAR